MPNEGIEIWAHLLWYSSLLSKRMSGYRGWARHKNTAIHMFNFFVGIKRPCLILWFLVLYKVQTTWSSSLFCLAALQRLIPLRHCLFCAPTSSCHVASWAPLKYWLMTWHTQMTQWISGGGRTFSFSFSLLIDIFLWHWIGTMHYVSCFVKNSNFDHEFNSTHFQWLKDIVIWLVRSEICVFMITK